MIFKGKDTYCVAKDLFPGEPYLAQVRCINRIGHGPWSSPLQFNAGAAPPFAPNEPTVIVRSPTHLTVSWNEPQTNGAPITEYRLECAVNDQDDCYNIQYQGVQTSAEVRNLIPFSTYYFRVWASNSAGNSPFSPVALSQTPAAAPNVPTIESHETTSSAVYLAWTEPESNGSPILHYNIEYGDHLISTEANVREWTIDDLSPETVYRFKIQAVNSIGAGQFSGAFRITTNPLPPKPPKLECIAIGHNFLKIKWGDGKNPEFIRFYLELYNARAKEFQVVYTGTSYLYRVVKLQEQCDHVFRICAETDHAGVGDYSEEYIFRTTAASPSSIKAPRIVENDKLSSLLTPSTSTASAIPVVADRNSITLEWQHSKNSFTDVIEYVLQSSKGKEQEFKLVGSTIDHNRLTQSLTNPISFRSQVHRGTETRHTIDNLEFGIEYTFRVCPVRITESGDLFGTYSPPMRHTLVRSAETFPSSSLQNQTPNAELLDTTFSSSAKGTSGSVKRLIGRFTSIGSNRNRLTDQEKAFFIVLFFMVVTIGFATVIKMFIR